MVKDPRKQIFISKHELELIQMCIRHDIETLYQHNKITLDIRKEIAALISLSAKLEDRWYKK